VHSAPSVTLGHPDVDAWLATRSPGFRSHLRRMRRLLAKAGGRIRQATAQTLHADLEAMFALHAGRWAGRGRSAFAGNHDAVVRMLAQVGSTELATHRLQLWIVELDGAPIAVQLFASADRTAVHWNGGWDERHARLSPGMLAILAGIEFAIERGVDRLDLGAGAQPYKLRFADGSVPNAWGHLVVPGRRVVGTSMTLTGPAARSVATRFVRRSLPGDRLDQLRRMRARLGIG
jgi:CelD/BcsL family acetyltransferase involved in cellulose biosynthesis